MQGLVAASVLGEMLSKAKVLMISMIFMYQLPTAMVIPQEYMHRHWR